MSKYVLDASAVLTILNQEPGKERVEAILGQAATGAVNVAETIGKLMDAGMRRRECKSDPGVVAPGSH